MEQKKELDPQIVERAKTDSGAFGLLYDFYFPRVYAFVMAKVCNQSAAEDIVSDVFMRILENLPKYQDRGLPFGAWMFSVVRNVVFDYYAKNHRSEHLPLEEGLEIKDDKKDFQPAHQAKESELKEKVRDVMKKLPEREMSILQMKFFSGLTNREIAMVLNLSESNVGIIVYRVLRKIKPDLNNLF